MNKNQLLNKATAEKKKIISTINSCQNMMHLIATQRMINLFKAKYKGVAFEIAVQEIEELHKEKTDSLTVS